MIRYGKPSAPLLAHKQAFFAENERLRREKLAMSRLYIAQPRRVRCKNCDAPFEGESFAKDGVGYSECARCGHLNGVHEDSDAFCEVAYTGEAEGAYAAGYSAQDRDGYFRRARDIYVPKAEFLRDGFREDGLTPESLAYADLGAGSGYFVAALREIGFDNAFGYEISGQQVALANAMLGQPLVHQHASGDVVPLVASLEADVVSMIGVLEHVRQPREVLAAIRDNPRVDYIYLSVPLFSPCVFFEAAFPDVMPRHLTARHTHLYTESSIDWLCGEFGFERRSEWWFGTDLVDLYRSIAVRLGEDELTRPMTERWRTFMLPVLDAMQMEMDRQHISSEVHMLLRKRGS